MTPDESLALRYRCEQAEAEVERLREDLRIAKAVREFQGDVWLGAEAALAALRDELEAEKALWAAEHATVMRLLSERDAFAIEMKDEACAAVDKVTAASCDKIDALNQRHAEIVSVVADIAKAYSAGQKHHAEAVEQAFREALGYSCNGSVDAAWDRSTAKARLT